MKETLTCTSCGKDWKREVTRGRKPKLCKKCFKDELKQQQTKTAAKVKAKAVKAKVVKATPVEETVPEQPKRRGRPPRVVIAEVPSPPPPAPIQSSELTLGQVWNVLVPKHARWREIEAETENGSRWQCPKCKWILEVNVALIDIPYHKCSPASSRVQNLERID